MSLPADTYARTLSGAVARAFSMLDANPASRTYGCFDRAFWSYRTITAFPGAIWQRQALPLALLATGTRNDVGALREPCREAALAGLKWWATDALHADGSTDEFYRNERSYCSTGFSTWSAALALERLGAQADGQHEIILDGLRCAAWWLVRQFNPTVMNQNLSAALALSVCGRLLNDKALQGKASERLAKTLQHQRSEGWFPEYGGFDYGYSTLSLDLLALLHREGRGADVGIAVDRLIGLLAKLDGPGAGIPGRLGSRGTCHLFPFGVEYFAASDPRAAALAARWRRKHETGAPPRPSSVDDRYFANFYFPHFALAYDIADDAHAAEAAPPDYQGSISLVEAGLEIRFGDGCRVSISTALGGSLAVERPGEVIHYDLGYEISTASGRRYATAAAGATVVLDHGEHDVTVQAGFRRIYDDLPLRRWNVPFHLFTGMLRWSWIAVPIQAAIRRRYVSPAEWAPVDVVRTIRFQGGVIEVEDIITARSGSAVDRLYTGMHITMHSASARQDRGMAIRPPLANSDAAARELSAKGKLRLLWRAEISAAPPPSSRTLDKEAVRL